MRIEISKALRSSVVKEDASVCGPGQCLLKLFTLSLFCMFLNVHTNGLKQKQLYSFLHTTN